MSQSQVCSHCGRITRSTNSVVLYDELGGYAGEHAAVECGTDKPCCACGDDRFLNPDLYDEAGRPHPNMVPEGVVAQFAADEE